MVRIRRSVMVLHGPLDARESLFHSNLQNAAVLSLGAALNAIAEMNKAARPALPGTAGAVDVDAEVVAATAGKSARGTNYARSAREKAVPHLEALLNTEVGRRHGERIRKVIEAVELLLQTIEAEEDAAAPAEEWGEPEPAVIEEIAPPQPRSYAHPQAPAPAPATATSLEAKGARLASFLGGDVIHAEEAGAAPAAPLVERATPAEGRINLGALFPVSTPGESYESMSDLVVEHGGGAAAAKAVGCAYSSFRNHRSRLKKAMEQGEG